MGRPKKITLSQIRAMIQTSVDKAYAKYQGEVESKADLPDNEYLKWFHKIWDEIVANECYFIVRDPLSFHIIFDLITSVLNKQAAQGANLPYVHEIGFRVLALYCLYFSQPVLSKEDAAKLRDLMLGQIKDERSDSAEQRQNKNLAREAIDFDPNTVSGSPIRVTHPQMNFFIDQLGQNDGPRNLLYKKCLNRIDVDGGFCYCEGDPLTLLYELDPTLRNLSSDEFITSLKEREKIVEEATSRIQAIRKQVQVKDEDLDLNLRPELKQVEEREKGFWEVNRGTSKYVIEKFTHQLRNKLKK
jgi:hypothetical protein